MEASSDIVSREASSVEDPEGVGDDPGVGHEPGVDPEVEDGLMVVVIFVVTFVLLLKLHVEFLFEPLYKNRKIFQDFFPPRKNFWGTRSDTLK